MAILLRFDPNSINRLLGRDTATAVATSEFQKASEYIVEDGLLYTMDMDSNATWYHGIRVVDLEGKTDHIPIHSHSRICVKDNWVYYVDATDQSAVLAKMLPDGTQKTEMCDFGTHPLYWDVNIVAINGDWLYIRLYNDVVAVNITTHERKTLISENESSKIDSRSDYIEFIDGEWLYLRSQTYNGQNQILKLNLNSGNVFTLVSTKDSINDIVLDGEWIYYHNYYTMYRIKNNGSSKEELAEWGKRGGFLGSPFINYGWLYWTENNTILRLNLTEHTPVDEIYEADSAHGIFILSINNDIIYFIANFDSYYWCSVKLDGTDFRVIETSI